MKVIAGDEVKNFDQIKVGDQVVASYTQELVMTLKKGGGALRERIDSSEKGPPQRAKSQPPTRRKRLPSSPMYNRLTSRSRR
jgi:hypothetical protein